MYPSSSSSSSSPGSMGPTNTGQGDGCGGSSLTRYDSAPGCLLTTAVDSLIGPNRDFSSASTVRSQTQMGPPPFFPASDTSSVNFESTCKANKSSSSGLQTTYGFSGMGIGTGQFGIASKTGAASGNGGGGGAGMSSSSLVRHSSSPAGFLHHLSATVDNGFSLGRGTGSYSSKGTSESGTGMSRLNSRQSFTRQDSLSQISEENQNPVDGICTENSQRKAAHAFSSASFGIGSWDDANAIIFSAPPSKLAKNIGSDPVSSLGAIESQLQFGLPHTALEMGTVESVLIPQDSVPCKIRAKRGFATHPRSIAERERRTRISGKLKKLQELVPNMDKQTSYADMLDLAVQHIKGLQHEVQELNKELENCTCGCKPNTQS